MSVFRNYDKSSAGGVIQNALPRVHSIPWEPTQRNVRANPGIPSQPQRISPSERGAFHPSSASGGGTLAPSMSSGSCSGCSGCNGSASVTLTASNVSTTPSFPSKARPILRAQPRMVGALRPTLTQGTSVRSGARQMFGMR